MLNSIWRNRAVIAFFPGFLILAFLAIAEDSPLPVPKIHHEGRALRFDFPDMKVGVAEYEEGPTGTTVFYFPEGVKGAVDVRGGSPGTVNATVLMNSYEYKMIQGVVFSGGSWYGLSAATGVANGIKELKAEEGNVDFISGVVGAIIYDVGSRRFSRVTPDDRLGKAALLSAETGWFPLGSRGAGRFAMQGGYYIRGDGADAFANWPHSGQGGAFRTIGPTRIGVFTVVNSLGTIVDRNGRVIRCERNNVSKTCSSIAEKLAAFPPIRHDSESKVVGPTGNTTLTLIVTNQKLPFWALRRLAVQVHTSMSRAIQPFATEDDGDVLYAVTTDEIDNESLSLTDLGVIASELAWDAVLSSVPDLPKAPTPITTKPQAEDLKKLTGIYDLYGDAELTVAFEEDTLTIACNGNGRIYFDQNRKYRLNPAERGQFLMESPGLDVIRFEKQNEVITSLTINPGPWSIEALRRQ